MNDPRKVWRYVVEFVAPQSQLTDTWSGRARALTKNAVEEYVETRLDRERPGSKIIRLEVFPAAAEDAESNLVIFTKNEHTATKPIKVKDEEESADPMKYYKEYIITPGIGLAGKDSESEFYKTIPHE